MTTLTINRIDSTLNDVRPYLRRTPAIALDTVLMPGVAELWGKFEFWQVTGSFKARGALANMLELDAEQRQRGVTAVSAGNHAIATAFAARELNVDAKVVMTATAPKIRVQRCEALGAEVVLATDVHAAFDQMHALVRDESRTAIHPFEGLTTASATAGVGREFAIDVQGLDAVIVPVGGGGLAAGVAAAVKLTQPNCAVFGVEPVGADSMRQSLAQGSPVTLDRVSTIADSLGAPMALPVSFGLCERYLDDVVLVTDDALRHSMRQLFEILGIAVEPACAASLAAANGPLADRLAGKRVGLILCGSNIDPATWHRLVNDE